SVMFSALSAASAASGRSAGYLRYEGSTRWVSKKTGLVYGEDDTFGNRVLHVLNHTTDNLSKPKQGIFSVSRSEVLPLIDEGYELAQQNPQYLINTSGGRSRYSIPMGRVIGSQGGAQGNGGPLTNLFLVLEGNEVITAYPW